MMICNFHHFQWLLNPLHEKTLPLKPVLRMLISNMPWQIQNSEKDRLLLMQRVADDIFRCAWKDTEHWERPQCCHSQNFSPCSWPPTHDRTLCEGQRTKGASSSYCSKMSTSSRLSLFLGRPSSTIACCCCCFSTRTLLLSCSLHFCPRTHFQHLGPYFWVNQSVQGLPEKLCVLFRFIIE